MERHSLMPANPGGTPTIPRSSPFGRAIAMPAGLPRRIKQGTDITVPRPNASGWLGQMRTGASDSAARAIRSRRPASRCLPVAAPPLCFDWDDADQGVPHDRTGRHGISHQVGAFRSGPDRNADLAVVLAHLVIQHVQPQDRNHVAVSGQPPIGWLSHTESMVNRSRPTGSPIGNGVGGQ